MSDKSEVSSTGKSEILSHTDYNIFFESKLVDGVPVEVLDLGMLEVPTGELVACDPLAYPDIPPFEIKVSPGSYPVKIYVAKTPDSGDRYALAKLELNEGKAVKWVLALREGEDINELKEKGDFFGFPVEAGLGGFFDLKAGLLYGNFVNEFMQANPQGNIYDDFFAREFKKNAILQEDPNDIGDWINFEIPGTGLNLTMFHSGYGDGTYPCYWGIDEQGNPVSLVIDFFVLLLPEEA